MHKLHAAQESGSSKTSHIADHTATNRDHQRLAISSRTAEGSRDLLHTAQILRRFRVIEEMDGVAFRKPQPALNRFPLGAPDFGRRNNVYARKSAKGGNFLGGAANHA